MSKNWSYIRDEWLKSTTIAEDDAKWALEALINTEEDLFEIERKFKNNQDVLELVRSLKKKVKETISSKEIISFTSELIKFLIFQATLILVKKLPTYFN